MDRFRRLTRWLATAGMAPARRRQPAGACGRRAVIVHLDGVSHGALCAAMREGHAPFLARLLEEGTHRCSAYLVGAPASTSAFQAGFLYGRVDDVPGYLWYDKRRRRHVRMDRSADAKRIERRHANGDPGLLAGGTSYTTLFAGGAAAPALNLARVSTMQWNVGFRHWEPRLAALALGGLGVRLLGRAALEVGPSIADGLRWATKVGRFDWEWRLLGMRLLTSIPLWEFAVWGTVGDMAHGVPIVYTCIVDYDEIGHRRGPRSPLAMRFLRSADRAAETIFAAAAAWPEMGYDVFVLADHGMVDAVPFAALDGRDLPAFLCAAAEGERSAERHARLRALGDRLVPPVGWIVHQRARTAATPPAGVQIVDAGDIAHLYFTDIEAPATFEQARSLQPKIVEALRRSGAVPFLLARGEHGPMLIAGDRVIRLDDGRVAERLREIPGFAARADVLAGYLRRVIAMPSAGDLVLYGNGGSTTVAFSWEFGSHGGIGADEIEGFVIHPRDAPFDFRAVRRPEELHRFFVRYRPEPNRRVPPPAAAD